MSWNEASNICYKLGWYLPVFPSGKELDEFVSIIKKSPFFPPVYAVFIGLKFVSANQVRIFPEFCQASWSVVSFCSTESTMSILLFQTVARWTNNDPLSFYATHINHTKINSSVDLCHQQTKSFRAHMKSCGFMYEQNAELKQSLQVKMNCDNKVPPTACTVMFLINLALPHWKGVACDKPYIGDVFCSFQKNVSSTKRNQTHDDRMCTGGSIKKFSECHSFSWTNTKLALKRKNRMKFYIDSSQLLFLFDSINTVFPPIFSYDLRHRLLYHRYSNIYNYTQDAVDNKSEAFVVQTNVLRPAVISGNIFSCKGVHMSYIHFNQCKRVNNDLTVHHNTKDECPLIMYKSHYGACQLYFVLDQPDVTNIPPDIIQDSSPSQNNTCCHDKSWTLCPKVHKNGLVLNKFGSENACSKRGQISCVVSDGSCYNVSNICIYMLDTQGKITPCQAGGHLYNCREFECNMMFKCLQYYCIPWGYVCNGKWDCPGGHDEQNYQACGGNRLCIHLFKCWGSQKCIHLGDVCNNVKNCPRNDDELMCSLWDISQQKCPHSCNCLLFVLHCYQVKNFVVSKVHVLPYIAVFYVKTRRQTTLLNIQHQYVSILHVIDSHFVDCCVLLTGKPFLAYFNAELNAISEVGKGCVNNLLHLKLLKLNDNKILNIHSNGFVNVSALLFLNVSNNFLKSLPDAFLKGFPSLRIMSIQGNNLNNLEEEMFEGQQLKLIESEKYQVCCFVYLSAGCTTNKPWHVSCRNLLPNVSLSVVFIVIAINTLVTNVISVICQVVSFKKKMDKTMVYGTIIISGSIINVTSAIQLSIICAADKYYHGNFILQCDSWVSSPWCYGTFALTLNFSILSPLLLSLLALARLMIVLHPFTSKFKRTEFVAKGIILMCCVSAVISICLAILVWAIYGQIP